MPKPKRPSTPTPINKSLVLEFVPCCGRKAGCCATGLWATLGEAFFLPPEKSATNGIKLVARLVPMAKPCPTLGPLDG